MTLMSTTTKALASASAVDADVDADAIEKPQHFWPPEVVDCMK